MPKRITWAERKTNGETTIGSGFKPLWIQFYPKTGSSTERARNPIHKLNEWRRLCFVSQNTFSPHFELGGSQTVFTNDFLLTFGSFNADSNRKSSIFAVLKSNAYRSSCWQVGRKILDNAFPNLRTLLGVLAFSFHNFNQDGLLPIGFCLEKLLNNRRQRGIPSDQKRGLLPIGFQVVAYQTQTVGIDIFDSEFGSFSLFLCNLHAGSDSSAVGDRLVG